MTGIYDNNPQRSQLLCQRLRSAIPVLAPEKLVPECDLLIEAASTQAVPQLLSLVIAHKKSMLVMSTGGLLLNPALLKRAIRSQIPVYAPSGALVGLDGIKAAATEGLRSVTLTTRKPPRAFTGLGCLKRPQLLFQGSAGKAVMAFPQNINVAATLALAGLGPARTRVRLIADPAVRENIHEVEAVGSFGRLFSRTENRPSAENPKTSRLAFQSAVVTLRQILQPFKVGT